MNNLFGKLPVSQPLTREQMLLRRQTAIGSYNILSSDTSPMPSLTRPANLSDEIDEELLFRFGYVPFVIAEVAWDYIDTIFDLTVILGISETRKINRALNNLRQDYVSLRRSVYNGADQHEEQNMILFQEELKEEFSEMCQYCCGEVVKEYPDINDEYKMLLGCVYVCRMVFSALFQYMADMKAQVERKVRHTVGDILPNHLRKMNDLVLLYVGDTPLKQERTDEWKRMVDNLVKYIHKIQLNKND